MRARMKKVILILLGVAFGIAGSVALRYLRTSNPVPVGFQVDSAAKTKSGTEERRKIAWKIIAPRVEIA